MTKPDPGSFRDPLSQVFATDGEILRGLSPQGLAEFEDISLGELMEKIVLHSFDPVPGDEGESCASPHSRRELEAIARLREVFGMDYKVHATRDFVQQANGSEAGVGEHD